MKRLILLPLAALSACAWLPQPTPVPPAAVQAVPPAWTLPAGAGAQRDLAGWWGDFGDPLLVELVERAQRANPSLEAAGAALRQARALRDVAAAALATTVSLSASAQSSKNGDAAAARTYNATIDAAWEPDWFGTRRLSLQASEGELEVARITLADARVSLAAEVAQAYITLRAGQERLAIARDNLASQSETEQITAWRAQAGLLTSLEAEQARAAREQAAARLPALETAVAQARHALAVLCGEAPGALDARLAAPRPLPLAGADFAVSLPAQTLAQRADVRSAQTRVSIAEARFRQADAARLPSLKLEGSIGLHGLGIGGVSTTWLTALLGSITGRAFDGGAARAQMAAEAGALAVAQANYRSTILQALLEVEDDLQSLAADKARAARLTQARDAAANAALLARQRYASGLTDFQTVLETQRNLFSTQDDLAATRSALAADQVRLYKALGGGWEAPPIAGKTTP
ncbi:efflux transporter outer membrane subunit [Massilia sp. TS11]|uniref:efflux transporter outer membrane subunit n=1 Tax=Massilia sp. TS11 TaxID=2908003 RepID=UPI001EDA4497|nr:efflux transporter outer membrane subunit [Massilia sp. TS11]MCG2583974.1 efflux transporter outer membrane subunit [Massilia sp. TS11]